MAFPSRPSVVEGECGAPSHDVLGHDFVLVLFGLAAGEASQACAVGGRMRTIRARPRTDGQRTQEKRRRKQRATRWDDTGEGG